MFSTVRHSSGWFGDTFQSIAHLVLSHTVQRLLLSLLLTVDCEMIEVNSGRYDDSAEDKEGDQCPEDARDGHEECVAELHCDGKDAV